MSCASLLLLLLLLLPLPLQSHHQHHMPLETTKEGSSEKEAGRKGGNMKQQKAVNMVAQSPSLSLKSIALGSVSFPAHSSLVLI